MLRFFLSDLRRNLTKILCLTAGLAIGLILVAKIYFEASFDTCHPDSDRIYLIKQSFNMADEYRDYTQTPGAIGPGLKRYVPQVEEATRATYFWGNGTLRLDDGRTFEFDRAYMADSCFFDVFSREIVAGDPHEALSVSRSVMIPRSLADKIGGDPIGRQFTVPDLSDSYSVTIRGVYEDFPLNSSIPSAIYLSLNSITDLSYDGRQNWMGNDRYMTFVRLSPGASPADMQPHVDRMMAENIDKETLDSTHFNVFALPIADLHSGDSSVKTMIWVLSILAFIILVSASLNFLLIVIGQMGQRQKEMAIRKCYGTSAAAIFGRIMGESLFFLIVSLALAVLTVLSFSDECGRLIGYTAVEILTTPGVWGVELAVCLLLFILTGVVPAWMYCRTPVVNAFRSHSYSRRAWKLALLFVQFFASAMLLCLVVLVGRQYHMISNTDPGYRADNLAYLYQGALTQAQRRNLMARLRELPSVEGVASAYQDITSGASGNNIWLDGDPERTFNVADFYDTQPEMPAVVGMEFVQGHTFDESADSTLNQVIVEEKMIDVFRDRFGKDDDNLIGQVFFMSEHWEGNRPLPLTIVGVVRNMRRGGFVESRVDARPAVMFPSSDEENYLYIRFHRLTPATLAEAQSVVNEAVPDREMYITAIRSVLAAQNAPVRTFGTSVTIAGIVVVVITIIGLIGYTSDEVQRRAREIAIRKVNGTSTDSILRLFISDIARVAIPATVLGAVGALVVGNDWLGQFTVRVGLSPLAMAACVAGLLLLLLGVTALNALHIARSNPVKYLRNE